jgi:membrane-bound lytic murein transglycosylase A
VFLPLVARRRGLAPTTHREPDDEDRKRERDTRFDEEPDHGLRWCRLSLVALAAIGAACTSLPPPPPRPASELTRTILTPVAFAELPGWLDDPVAEAWAAFLTGCRVLVEQSTTSAIWREPCNAATTFDAHDSIAVRAFFERYFSAYRAVAPDGTDTGLVTGYYEPLLDGSRTASERYRYPLFAPPDDLLTVDLGALYPELNGKRVRGRLDGRRVVPYWSRADIEGGRAPVAGKELVFVDDPVEAFFLQIQGSGRIRLAEGGVMRIGYADQNGHPFRSIARILLERGAIDPGQATLQGLKAWAHEHPQEVTSLLNENPSYVFFREVIPNPSALVDGPIGTLAVPLAAGRTIAVDVRSIPLGAPVFLATTWPLSNRPLNRLVFAQDTGGAIRGPLRVDFFWGFGEEAAHEAGRTKQPGRLWVLWPKGAPLP